MHNNWTEEEVNYIIDNYLNMTDIELSNHLTRHSVSGITTKRKKLKCNRTNQKYTFDDVVKECVKRDYILLSEKSEYKDCLSKMRYVCKKHLDKGEQTIGYGHLRSGEGCYWCGREITEASRRKDINSVEEIEECKNICESKGFEFIDISKQGGIIYIHFICPNHQNVGVQQMRKNNMKRENIVGCKYCVDSKKYKFSKGEQKIVRYLQEHNINYIRQYTFDDCKDVLSLPFDFYLIDFNMIIEYDGEHHFKPVKFNGITDEQAEENFLNTIRHDRIKNNYCAKNDIHIIRIPYWDMKNITKILDNI